MAVVWIPSLLRALTGGLSEVRAPGATVREVIDALEQTHPGLKARLVGEDGRLKPNLALVVDGVNSKQGLRHPVEENTEVHFVPAMSGGSEGVDAGLVADRFRLTPGLTSKSAQL